MCERPLCAADCSRGTIFCSGVFEASVRLAFNTRLLQWLQAPSSCAANCTMSLGYASRLSHREDLGGRLGDPELSDAPHCAWDKACKLAELIQDAKKVIVFTGAGISTACGIPDFRGPQGVWTCQRKGLPPPKLQTSFLYAKPSLTHQALLGLLQSGKLDYICSQNVDSLHLRSGVPRSQIAELHGNCFAERCKKCKKEYVRDFEMDTVGFKPTGRRCTQPNCRGQLIDHILDWEDALPDDEFKATQKHATSADLALCLGTSLQIIPAANLPLRTVKAGGKLAIINLQGTPKDKRADVVIHAKVDEVMAVVMQQLELPLPEYKRTDQILLSHSYTAVSSSGKASSAKQEQEQQDKKQTAAQQQQPHEQEPVNAVNAPAGNAGTGGTSPSAGDAVSNPAAVPAAAETSSPAADDDAAANGITNSSSSWGFSFCISSVHGPSCPLPMVASATVMFLGPAAAALKSREFSGQLPWRLSRTCPDSLQEVQVQVKLQLVEEADEDKKEQLVHYTITRPAEPSTSRPAATRRASAQLQADVSQEFGFVTQVYDYTERQQQLIQQLQAAAEQSRLTASQDAEAAAAGSQGKKRPSAESSKRGANKMDNSSGISVPGGAGSGGSGASAGPAAEQQAVSVTVATTAQMSDSSEGAYEDQESDQLNGSAGSTEDGGDADFVVDGEPTGIDGQNSSGRARKRTRRLNM